MALAMNSELLRCTIWFFTPVLFVIIGIVSVSNTGIYKTSVPNQLGEMLH